MEELKGELSAEQTAETRAPLTVAEKLALGIVETSLADLTLDDLKAFCGIVNSVECQALGSFETTTREQMQDMAAEYLRSAGMDEVARNAQEISARRGVEGIAPEIMAAVQERTVEFQRLTEQSRNTIVGLRSTITREAGEMNLSTAEDRQLRFCLRKMDEELEKIKPKKPMTRGKKLLAGIGTVAALGTAGTLGALALSRFRKRQGKKSESEGETSESEEETSESEGEKSESKVETSESEGEKSESKEEKSESKEEEPESQGEKEPVSRRRPKYKFFTRYKPVSVKHASVSPSIETALSAERINATYVKIVQTWNAYITALRTKTTGMKFDEAKLNLIAAIARLQLLRPAELQNYRGAEEARSALIQALVDGKFDEATARVINKLGQALQQEERVAER
jgi:hypothetical protein